MSSPYRTDVCICLVFLYQQHCFRLVAQFCAYVSPRVLISLVLMQDGVNVYLPLVRPCHQQGDDVRRFAGAIDVVDHIPDAINDD